MTEDLASSKMAQRKDMLLMAQQRLDEINRGNMGLVGGGGSRRPGSATSKQHKHQQQQHQQLLSTLLYVALMSYKLEDMKVMLKEEDPIAYLEWRSLLENLHSPEFHSHERILQNQRVSTVYERKRYYREKSTRLEAELIDTKQLLFELQRTMNETSYSTSKTINAMQEERAVIVTTVDEGRRVINEMKTEMECLRVESAKNDVKLQSLRVELDKKNSLLVEKKTVIDELEGKMSQYRQEAALATKDANLARSAFEEVKVKLNARENACEEKSLSIGMLQRDNAVMNAKLVAMTESLDATTKKLNASENTCDEKNLTIGMLQRDIAATNAKLVATTESLDATTKNLNSSVSVCDEKNLTIGMLQRDNAVMNAKLVATTESLDDAKKNLNSSVSVCDEKNLTIGLLQRDIAAMNAKLVAGNESLDAVTKKLNFSENTCNEKNLAIGIMQRDNAVMNAKLDAMTESLVDAKKNLNASENACEEKSLSIGMLQRDNAVMNAKLVAMTESLDATTKKLNASENTCDEKNLTIGMLQRDIAATNAKLDAMTESLVDAKKNLNSSVSVCDEKNLTIGLLQRDNAVMNAKLVATTESFDDAKKNLEASRNFIAATASSFEGLKFQSNHLSDLLNDLVVFNTKDTTQAELLKIQQSVDDIAQLRQEDGLRQHIEVVQQRLDVMHEFQRKHTSVQTELIDVEYRLRDVIVTQSNNLADVMTNKLDFNIKETGCLFDRSRDDMKEISDALTDVSSKAASLESRMCQVHEVVSTLSTSTTLDSYTNEIQSRLLSVKGMVGDLHRNQSALQTELVDVEHRLKDLLVTQSSNISTAIDNLDGNILKQTVCMLEESREDLKEVLAHGKQVSDALSVLSKTVADNSASLDGQLSQGHAVMSALSSSKALESFSRDVCSELSSMKQGLEHLVQQQSKGNCRNKISKEDHESIEANELASSYISEALQRLSSVESKVAPPKLIIAGAPASGKGTQCELIKQHFGVVHLSTGDILRAAVSSGMDIGKTAKAYMDAGKLVPDSVIIGVVKERLVAPDCVECGWLLDGFPRTLAQAMALENAGIHADCFIFLNVPDSVLVERVVGRRTDPVTGKIYHMKFNPPKDEIVLARLSQRSDDTEEKIKVRLEQFHSNVAAVKDCYTSIAIEVDGTKIPEDVSKVIIQSIEVKRRLNGEH